MGRCLEIINPAKKKNDVHQHILEFNVIQEIKMPKNEFINEVQSEANKTKISK